MQARAARARRRAAAAEEEAVSVEKEVETALALAASTASAAAKLVTGGAAGGAAGAAAAETARAAVAARVAVAAMRGPAPARNKREAQGAQSARRGAAAADEATSRAGAVSDGRCMHQTCLPVDTQRAKFDPNIDGLYDRAKMPRWQMQATKALPRLDPRTHPGAIVPDMTPNYLCSPKALRNMVGSVGAPTHFKLMLLLRPPREAIIASYKMFVRWGWVRSDNLTLEVVQQLDRLSKCNRSLYDHPKRLASLPGEEVLQYFGRCWNGVWRTFVTNALPFVCARSWIAAGFKPSQFAVLHQARMRKMTAPELLSGLEAATGLHYNKAVLHDKEEELVRHCEAPDSVSNTRFSLRGGHKAAVMVNSHSKYEGDNARARTGTQSAVWREFDRIANTHQALLEGLHLPQV